MEKQFGIGSFYIGLLKNNLEQVLLKGNSRLYFKSSLEQVVSKEMSENWVDII